MAAEKKTKKDSIDSKETKKTKESKENPQENKVLSFFKDERFRLLLFLFLIIFAVFQTFAFISYFFTWKADQSFQFQQLISSSDIKVENWAGKTGARIATLFITQWFGIASFTIPLMLIVLALKLIKLKIFSLQKNLQILIILTILLSVTLGYLFGDMNGYLGSGIGGNHGYVISNYLNSLIGKLGTGFLLLILFSSFILYAFPKSLDIFKDIFSSPPKEIDENLPVAPESESDDIPTLDKDKIYEDNTDLVIEIEKGSDTLETSPITAFEPLEPELISEKDEIDLKESKDELELETIQTEESTETDSSETAFDASELGPYDPSLDLSSYKMPPIDLLEKHEQKELEVSNEELISNKNKIVKTLNDYKILITKIKATIGPTVTLYEIVPAAGVKISKIKNLEDDIALSLSALGIRIIAPIPGKGTIGIEVPNIQPQIVSMRSILASPKFQESKADLPVAIGKTISNETFVFDLAKMPHLLVAGATGQGKSVGLNAIITSLMYKMHPAYLKFVFIDPKKVELSVYSKIEKHYLAKIPDTEEAIITDTQKVITTLNSLTVLMDSRYDLLKKAKVRNLKEYNEKFTNRRLNPQHGHHFMPYIVLVIDEFADLIMTAGKEIETPIARLAQLARAIGIHLIIATQRPTTNIITGVIKANFPARIAFRVSSMIDSRTILDQSGANQLIGRGDMLITSGNDLIRIQCAFIDTNEVERLVDFVGNQQSFPCAYELPEFKKEDGSDNTEMDPSKRDDLFDDAARLVVEHQQGSTSLIQRRFSIGYNRAGRIIDQLENAGIVGKFEGSKARNVMYTDLNSLEQYLNSFKNKL